MSERQVTRERRRAIALLTAELEAGLPSERPLPSLERAAESREYHPEPIPAILGFLPRPGPMRALRSALAEHPLVHVHGPPGGGKSSLVAELAQELAEKRPVLWYRFRSGVNDSLAALLFELGEYLRAGDSPALADLLEQALPDPNPVMATRLALRELAPVELLLVLDDLHTAADDPVVGIVAHILPHKGFDDLVQALPLIVQQIPRVRCLVVGEAPRKKYLAHLLDLAQRLAVRDRLIWLGAQEDVPRFLDAMDLFVLPSHTEGLPLTVLEAMAAGKPVIGTAVGGIPEAVRHGETGWLVSSGEADALAEAIKLALRGEPEVTARAQQEALQRFSKGHLIANIESLYDLLLEQKRVST